jgi:hypothetical protein
LFIRKLASFELGIDQVAVHREFEATASGGDQLEVLNLLLVRREKLARQTDGLRLIISHRTILEFQVHIFSFTYHETVTLVSYGRDKMESRHPGSQGTLHGN